MNFDFSLLLLAQEAAPGGAAPGFLEGMGIFPFLIMMLVMMYFLTIRPQRKKQKALDAQIASMKSGDNVVTVGGLHGLVTNIKDGTVILKVADNVKLEFEKPSIATVIKKENAQDKEVEATPAAIKP